MIEIPCPRCRELCPVEQLDKSVEIIDCCNHKWVVRVDGKLTPKFMGSCIEKAKK